MIPIWWTQAPSQKIKKWAVGAWQHVFGWLVLGILVVQFLLKCYLHIKQTVYAYCTAVSNNNHPMAPPVHGTNLTMATHWTCVYCCPNWFTLDACPSCQLKAEWVEVDSSLYIWPTWSHFQATTLSGRRNLCFHSCWQSHWEGLIFPTP